MSEPVELVEVGPRDGLQDADRAVGPEVRVELCRRLAGSGLTRIEAASFVRDDLVPNMAGAETVIAGAAGAGAELTALVLNAAGLRRVRAVKGRSVRFVVAISEPFNRRNAGVGVQEGLRAAEAVLGEAAVAGLQAGGVLATAFGCPFGGEVDSGRVIDAAHRLAAAGASEIIFADTIGVAVPRQVRAMLTAAAGVAARLGLHLHDTRATGYACALAGIEAGAQILDSSIGGLGGCPFAPGSSGNVATEDLAWMLAREGVATTPVDLDALIATAGWLRETTGLPAASRIARAGRFPLATGATRRR